MRNTCKLFFALSLTAAAVLPVQASEPADKYPSRPIRIMGQGAGSTADYLSRYIGQRLSERWGQPVVVDNRAGAGGTLS
ncbi:MAG: tripartite tricarboxylate transporter substrate binding protein, partial [Betaproteobacteria bacterium]|nr:tripartite tricarboxylate transporter substrate binding protein [Betaproteobacteria bacterium]